MYKKVNVYDEFPIINKEMDNIVYLGTNTIRYMLGLYKVQFITLDSQSQKNRSLAIQEVICLLQQKTILYNVILRLQKALSVGECKPPFAKCRYPDWFEIGDDVVCFVPDSEQKFVNGQIYDNSSLLHDYRHVLLVVYNQRIECSYFLNGYGGLYSITDPYIVKKWEYKYLMNNLEFAHLWIRQCVRQKYSLNDAILFSQAL